jgi:hypothetical protein
MRCEFSCQRTKEARTLPQEKFLGNGLAPKFSDGFSIEIWERETAPAGSLPVAIIGARLCGRFQIIYAIDADKPLAML